MQGQRVGRWTVIKYIPYIPGSRNRGIESKKKRAIWWCRCDCGKEKAVMASSLRSGKSMSCGCLQKEVTRNRYKDDKELKQSTLLNCHYNKYRGGAKKRGYDFNLSIKEFESIISKPCHYCGDAGTAYKYRGKTHSKFKCNGVDRVDNTKGYTADNCVPCCGHCNKAKRGMDINDFLELVSRIFNHRIRDKIPAVDR